MHDSWFCFTRTHCWGPITACHSHLKNLGTALEMYAADHGGVYPPSLDQLAPGYLNQLPHCPSEDPGCPLSPAYHYESVPNNYTILCTGPHHGRYTSRAGLEYV